MLLRMNILRKFLQISDLNATVVKRCSHAKPKVSSLPYNQIPTARRLPFIGTTLDLIAAGSAPKLHRYVDERHHQLGPIFREPIGPIEAIFLSCPTMMRSLFLYEGQYPQHPLPDSWIIYNRKHGCRRGLFFMDGKEWYKMRHVMNRLLLNGNEDQMKALVLFVTEQLIEKWKASCSSTSDRFYELTDLETQFYRWSINVLLFVMIGDIYKTASASLLNLVTEFTTNVHRIFNDSSKLMVFPAKIAESFNLSIWKRFETSVTNVLQMGSQIIDRSMAEFQTGNGLIAEMLQNQIGMDDIKRIFLDFIIAAGDTTAFSSIWMLHSLATNSDAQNDVRNEIANSQESDRKLVKGAIRETLRLYPVAPFIGRFLAKDAIIGGYEIPKGTLVLNSLYTSGRDENNFVEAKKFNPHRWLRTDTGELCGVNYANGTMPFALGSRSCIGRKIALIQMKTLVEQVLSSFHLKSLNQQPVDIVLRLIATPDTEVKIAIKPLAVT